MTNENGYPQDAALVNWTVYDSLGNRISGQSLPAVRVDTGEYYAPWYADVKNGNYTINWEVQQTYSQIPKVIPHKFFVVDPSSYQPCGTVQPNGNPISGGETFFSGTGLGPDDLHIYLKDSNGILTDAMFVFWTILNIAGSIVSPKTAALQFGPGSYYAPWTTIGLSGNYTILWEYQLNTSVPVQAAKMNFSIVNPAVPFVNQAQLSHKRQCDDRPPYQSALITSTIVYPPPDQTVCCTEVTVLDGYCFSGTFPTSQSTVSCSR